MHPPFLIFLEPHATTPVPLEKNKSTLSAQYSLANSVQYKNSPQGEAFIDMEISKLAFRYHYGITSYLEGGMEVNLLSYNTGIGDNPIAYFHRATGTPGGNQIHYKPNSFQYYVRDQNQVIFDAKPRSGFGDSTLSLKLKLMEEKVYMPAFSAGFFLELPTGSFKNRMGNGKIDSALGFIAKKSIWRLNFYLNLFFIYINNPFPNGPTKTRPYAAGSITSEFIYSDTFTIIMQFNQSQSPYVSNLNQLSSGASIISLGFNKTLFEKYVLQMSFSEDFSHYTVTDISGDFSLKFYY